MTHSVEPTNGWLKLPKLQRISTQPENPFSSLIPDQQIAVIPSFTLESGVVLHNVPIAYSTRGKLSANRDNALVICHALTGSADVCDWWGPLIGGEGRAFDLTRFYVICLNSLGSPYGSASPVTSKDGDPNQERYGPEFPLTTIRDDVHVHKIVLDDLGVRRIAAVIGGSMGGMLALEYAYFGKDYVAAVVAIATSSRHSAWGISWGEAQRQSIYSDPKYDDGYYSFEDPPTAGLGAARMSALLTYRSRDSFESRFGRNTPDPSKRQNINDSNRQAASSNEHWAIHNEGHKRAGLSRTSSAKGADALSLAPRSAAASTIAKEDLSNFTDPQFHGATQMMPNANPMPEQRRRATTYFSAQSYLRYQAEKFVKRFDSNCYIAITRKLDTHDISRNRAATGSPNPVMEALSQIEQPTLVLGIQSDGIFTFAEQQELAAGILNATLQTIDSPEGHDAFLLQFEQVNRHILKFFHRVLPDIMSVPGIDIDGLVDTGKAGGVGTARSSTFGEAEVEDITAW